MITYSVPCQRQINYAVATNASDANLTRWTKGGTLVTIPEVVLNSSRAMMVDPVPSWRGADGTWRMIAACNTLRACMWKAPTAMGPFTFVGGIGNTDTNHTGSFECPDFWRMPQTDTYVRTCSRRWERAMRWEDTCPTRTTRCPTSSLRFTARTSGRSLTRCTTMDRRARRRTALSSTRRTTVTCFGAA